MAEQKTSFVTFVILTMLFFIVFMSLAYSVGLLDTTIEKTNKFDEIKKSLISGNKLTMVIHYDKMNLAVNGSSVTASKTVSGFDIDSFFFDNSTLSGQKYITISHTQLINHQSFGISNSHLKATFYSDNTIEIKITYLSLDNFKILLEETYKSKLSAGAVHFYKVSPQRFTYEDNLGNRKALF